MSSTPLATLAPAWRAALDAAGVPLEAAVLDAWAELLEGSEADLEELEGLVALHARSLGESGRPASQAVLQVHVVSTLPGLTSKRQTLGPWIERLVRVAADAHAIGAATRLERRGSRRLRERLPVLEIPGGTVLACAVGRLDGDMLDVLLGRAFVVAMGAGAREVALDLGGADEIDERALLDTLVGFKRHELAGKLRLVVIGAPDPDGLTARLRTRGVGSEQVLSRALLVDPTPG